MQGEIDGEAAFSDPFPNDAPIRVLVFADYFGASQSLAFVHGLARARAAGEVGVRIVEEDALGPDGLGRADPDLSALIEREFGRSSPTHVVLSRFGHGRAYPAIRAAAAARALPVLLHIDDDLFDTPAAVGAERYRAARHPRRLRTLDLALAEADLVMAATPALAARLARIAGHPRIGWLDNGTAGLPRPRRRKPAGEPVVIGYMGSASHDADLEMVVPALNAVLEDCGDVRVELFGSITRQPSAERLPQGIDTHAVVARDYMAFKDRLAALDWDIGLAPLQASPYNRCKTATKWAEYAEAGIAVIASDMEVYRPMIEAGAALPARPAQWEAAIRRLVREAALRRTLVAAADDLLRSRFSWERLEASVLALVRRAARRPRAGLAA